MDDSALVFRRKAHSRMIKFLLIIAVNILIMALLILAVSNLDLLLFDQDTGEIKRRSGRILGILVMGLAIMLFISIQIGIKKDKSIHVTNEGLGFDLANAFNRPIPWSKFKSFKNTTDKTISFEMHDSSEYNNFTINLRDYNIGENDLPLLLKAIQEKLSDQ